MTVTPDGSHVDFIRGRNRQFALWRVPFLGGTPRRLAGDVHSPVGWAPDGRRIAWARSNPSNGTGALLVANADGAGERTVLARKNPQLFQTVLMTGEPGVRPAWSPDGNVIALLGLESLTLATQVVFANVESGSEQVVSLTKGETAAGLAWLDANAVVIVRSTGVGSPSQLWRLSYPSLEWSRITNDLTAYDGVSLTADRSALVTVRTETRGEVWVGDASGASGAAAVPMALRAGAPVAWSGDELLFVAATNGPPVIMRRRTTGGVEPIETGGLPSYDVTADGRTLVYVTADGGIWKRSIDGGQPTRLAEGFSMTVTPDGRQVLFLSDANGLQSPWVVSLDGGSPGRWPRCLPGRAASRPHETESWPSGRRTRPTRECFACATWPTAFLGRWRPRRARAGCATHSMGVGSRSSIRRRATSGPSRAPAGHLASSRDSPTARPLTTSRGRPMGNGWRSRAAPPRATLSCSRAFSAKGAYSLILHRVVDDVDPSQEAVNDRPDDRLVRRPGHRDRERAAEADAGLGGA